MQYRIGLTFSVGIACAYYLKSMFLIKFKRLKIIPVNIHFPYALYPNRKFQ